MAASAAAFHAVTVCQLLTRILVIGAVCQMSLTGSIPGVEKKYELVPDRQIIVAGTTLYRIRALKDFGKVKAGNLGGFVAPNLRAWLDIGFNSHSAGLVGLALVSTIGAIFPGARAAIRTALGSPK